MDIAYSEIFHSIQGEGTYTGHPTAWVRFFLCNLNCDGFGQREPTKPETYVLPYKDIDVSAYKQLEDLPVFEYGCDSSYSWSARFKHLQHVATPSQICDRIEDAMRHKYNPDGRFDVGEQHLCFTGGEPLLKPTQKAIIEICREFAHRGNVPSSITFETNGTQELSDAFVDFWLGESSSTILADTDLFFSVSPKLYSVSGERSNKAIRPKAVAGYYRLSTEGQLKFVCNGTDEAWQELENVIALFHDAGVNWPVWIMPVGATIESQSTPTTAEIAKEAFKRGYRVAARVHTYLWGNAIGT